MSSYRNKVVVISGASAGVGRATAVEFARLGASVALLARGQAGLEGARAEVEAAGGRAWTCILDVADAQAVDEAAPLSGLPGSDDGSCMSAFRR